VQEKTTLLQKSPKLGKGRDPPEREKEKGEEKCKEKEKMKAGEGTPHPPPLSKPSGSDSGNYQLLLMKYNNI